MSSVGAHQGRLVCDEFVFPTAMPARPPMPTPRTDSRAVYGYGMANPSETWVRAGHSCSLSVRRLDWPERARFACRADGGVRRDRVAGRTRRRRCGGWRGFRMRIGALGVSGVGRVGRGSVVGLRRLGDGMGRRADWRGGSSSGGPVDRPRRRFPVRRALPVPRGDPRQLDPPEVESQDAGNAVAYHGSEAHLRCAGGLWGAARTRGRRHERYHRNRGNCQPCGRANHRATINTADPDRLRTSRAAIPALGNRWCLDRALEGRRLLAPKIGGTGRGVVKARSRVLRARRRLIRGDRGGPRPERDELVPGSEPVAGEAHHFAPLLSLSLACLGLPTFPHPVEALFQRFLRRRRQCRPECALL